MEEHDSDGTEMVESDFCRTLKTSDLSMMLLCCPNV